MTDFQGVDMGNATNCAECDEVLPVRKPGASGRPRLYCSKSCYYRAYRRTHPRSQENSARECLAEDCSRGTHSRGWCRKHYKQLSPNARAWNNSGDPEKRRAALRVKTQLRRARMTDPDAEKVDRSVVGDRDGWICGLCSEVVNDSLPWPDPLSASLDHIKPLSMGGKHQYANTQIAHLRCNIAKGNRGGGRISQLG